MGCSSDEATDRCGGQLKSTGASRDVEGMQRESVGWHLDPTFDAPETTDCGGGQLKSTGASPDVEGRKRESIGLHLGPTFDAPEEHLGRWSEESWAGPSSRMIFKSCLESLCNKFSAPSPSDG